MDLEVSSEVIASIVAHAACVAPAECCGILLGCGHIINRALPADNVSPDALTRFEIDPAALLAAHREAREGGAQVVGYYHSHPRGKAVPSATDLAHASGDRRTWAIVADGHVTFWRDDGAQFTPLSYLLVDG